MKKHLIQLRSHVRRIYLNSNFLQFIVGCAYHIVGVDRVNLFHLLKYREDSFGPVQKDEAIALFGIIRTIRPATILEFGFFRGHSAYNFLAAAGPQCRVYSIDFGWDAERRAAIEYKNFKNFKFIRKPMQEFGSADVDHRKIDFVFVDAAHDFQMNADAFRNVEPLLSEGAIVAVHDTGPWMKKYFTAAHREHVATHPNRWLNDEEYIPHPDERRFVNWICAGYPGFVAITFHAKNTLRHGYTLLQKSYPLVNPGD